MRHLNITAALLLVSAIFASSAFAGEEVYAIQKRHFGRTHELAMVGGYIPDNDFHLSFPLGLSYTYNFNETFAWEVVRGQWVHNEDKDLVAELEADFGAMPEHFDTLQYLVHTSFVIKPSYGKDALWNELVVNHETYLTAGVGVAGYERTYSDGSTDTENAPSLSFGLGRKYFVNENICINLEVRDYVNFKTNDVENNFFLGIGMGLRFGVPEKGPAEDDMVGRMKRYLEED